MIAIHKIQEDPAAVINRLNIKGFEEAEKIVNVVLELDEKRRKIIQMLQDDQSEMNKIAKQVGIEMSKGNKEAAEVAKKQTQELKTRIGEQERLRGELEEQIRQMAVNLPNLPHESVPEGSSAEHNKIVREDEIDFALPADAKPHWELGQSLGLLNMELGVKITGGGFPVFLGKGARLVRALISFFLDSAAEAGYREAIPPLLVNETTAYSTGQLPDKEGQMYQTAEEGFYLIPTAEVPLTNIYRDEILEESGLPVKLCGYTPCFRREAGSYGKDVRGLNRVHQFDKVEIVQITSPEKSYAALDEMLAYASGLLEKLELRYRVALLCGGDLGFASAKTFDLEVFSGAQDRWLEVSSVSNFEDFQANRLKLRFRREGVKKPIIAHTLNGSALALPRVLAALLENNQQADGSIRVPAALRPYTGFDAIKSEG